MKKKDMAMFPSYPRITVPVWLEVTQRAFGCSAHFSEMKLSVGCLSESLYLELQCIHSISKSLLCLDLSVSCFYSALLSVYCGSRCNDLISVGLHAKYVSQGYR